MIGTDPNRPCSKCGKILPQSEYPKSYILEGRVYRRSQCKECHAAHSRLYNKELKEKVLLAYGNMCACCGALQAIVSSRSWLEIDHIAGGGKKDLREHFDGKNDKLYRFMLNFHPIEYRILCRGCNASMEPNQDRCYLHK